MARIGRLPALEKRAMQGHVGLASAVVVAIAHAVVPGPGENLETGHHVYPDPVSEGDADAVALDVNKGR